MYVIYRSDTSRSELAELAKQANPDEINIDDDEDDDNDQGPDGESVTSRTILHFFTISWIELCEHGCANCFVLFTFTEVQLEQKSVPTAVFGGLKDD